MQFTSSAAITSSGLTLQNRAIFSFISLVIFFSVLQIKMSGWIPTSLNALTLCWVGFVFTSPEALTKGRSVRWTYKTFWGPKSTLNCLMASRKGRLSMSPTVPPTSTIATSTPLPKPLILSLISSVICGITWTVSPRYSPRLSFCMTAS